jgi:hypothetical protein
MIMLIKEQFVEDDGKVLHVKTMDFNPALREVKQIQDAGPRTDGNWHVGRIPREMIGIWVKEAGLSFGDTEAVSDLVRKKLLSGEYDMLRPKLGTF